MVKEGADVNVQDEYGFTPLYLAVFRGNNEIAKFLIDNDADLTLKDYRGKTPLQVAIDKKFYELKELLIKNKAKI